ncbi:unnamed protein product [Eruca vesicaria subsp. sativa]|uniref:Uncharacterized protein n=1 Tax=Eruca vesicaria subsp. sativa TaxID=29727 RepID=A0ABC8KYN6_ERUVS|nr:unnamed protein product [Eruca vesicaria subsp. sativa]
MVMMDQYLPNAVGHPQGYIGNAQDLADAPSISYGSDRFEANGERARFRAEPEILGSTLGVSTGFNSRSQYPGGTASRFY